MMGRIMNPLALFRRRWRALARFAGDRRGVSAVEFALLAPLMIGLYLGGVEISQGVGIYRKVTLTAGALANLSSQATTISNADMTNILDAGTAIIAPYSTTTLKITVSCLTIDANGKATVSWSDTRNGTARTVGSVVTIPSALAVPNSSLVFSEVSYEYQPAVGYVITGSLNLADKMYMSPRLSTTVARTS